MAGLGDLFEEPSGPRVFTVALVEIGTTTYRWSTRAFRDSSVIGAGLKFWEERILSIGRLQRAIGSLRQFQKQTVEMVVANTDGALNALVRDLTDANNGYLHATVTLSQVAYDPADGNSEVKTLGKYRIDAVPRASGTMLVLRLVDKTELALGELLNTPTVSDLWNQLVVADANAYPDWKINPDVEELRCPFAFGQELVPGLPIVRLDLKAVTQATKLHWLFWVAKSGLTIPSIATLAQGFVAPNAQAQYALTQSWDNDLLKNYGYRVASPTTGPVFFVSPYPITLTLTSVTVDSVTWQVLWGRCLAYKLTQALSELYNGGSSAPVRGGGSGGPDLNSYAQEAVGYYERYTVLIGSNPVGLGARHCEGDGYTSKPTDIIRAIAENYSQGSSTYVDATSFNAARDHFSGLPAAGVVAPPRTALDVAQGICRSHGVDVFWGFDGKLRAVDPYPPDTIADDHTFTETDLIPPGGGEGDAFWEERTPEPGERGSLLTRVVIAGAKPYALTMPEWLDLKDSAGTKLETKYGRRIPGEVEVSWIARAAGIDRLILYVAAGSVLGVQEREMRFGVPGLRALRLELGEFIRVTWKAGFDANGYTARLFQVTGIDFDPMSVSAVVTAQLKDILDANRSYKPYILDNRANWQRYAAGTVTVAGGATSVQGNGTAFITAGVAVNDILVPSGGTPASGSPELRCAKVTAVNAESGAAALTISQSLSADAQTAITYRIERSHLTPPTNRAKYGRLCARATTVFSDAAVGYRLY